MKYYTCFSCEFHLLLLLSIITKTKVKEDYPLFRMDNLTCKKTCLNNFYPKVGCHHFALAFRMFNDDPLKNQFFTGLKIILQFFLPAFG
jgi:hypothetical protein